ncbi:MAG: thioredoxin family protein, partial [Raineya sp.]
QLFENGKTTSQDPHYNEEWVLNLTKLNFQRIARLEKTTEINPLLLQKVQNLPQKLIWVVLVESWCGDVAQNLPTLWHIAEQSKGKIELKLLLRDENLALMDMFLTNGGRAIPKLICLDENLQVLGTWGPRPQPVQELMQKAKAEGKEFQEISEIVHSWYAKDKTQTLQNEILSLLNFEKK